MAAIAVAGNVTFMTNPWDRKYSDRKPAAGSVGLPFFRADIDNYYCAEPACYAPALLLAALRMIPFRESTTDGA